MKNNFASFLLVLTLVASCSKKEVTPALETSVSSITFTETSSLSAAISITANMNWSAATSASWLTLSPASGTAGESVMIVKAASAIEDERTATVTITVGSLTKDIAVKQNEHVYDKEALVAIFNSTGGNSWSSHTNWNTSSSIATWEGVTVNTKGKVTKLLLPDHKLTGTIPAEISKLTDLTVLDLSGNSLTGSIPDGRGSLTKLEELYLDVNGLTGDIPAALEKLTALKSVTIDHNYLTGPVPASFVANGVSYTVSPQYGGRQVFIEHDTEGKGTHSDGEYVIYHQATKGKGFKIFITGDGFVEKNNSIGGTAQQVYEAAAEDILTDQVYSLLKDYLTIYIIYAKSPERGITIADYKVNNKFGSYMPYENQRYALTYTGNVLTFLKQSTGVDPTGSAVVLAINSLLYGGIAYGFTDDGTSVGVCLTDDYFSDVMRHEACGHGIARLADEYVSSGDASGFPMSYIKYYHDVGWYANVDDKSDSTSIYWSKFLADSRYKGLVGIYQGGYYRSSGVWRPSQSSMMNNYKDGWNVPSREAIYKRIMSEAVDGWKYDYESFVAFDAPIRLSSSTSSVSLFSTDDEELPESRRLPPPIIREGSWHDYE